MLTMAEKEFIEREALVQHMQECKGDSVFNIMATGYAYAFIKQAPAADVVEVVHGYWKDTEYGTCSACNRSISEIYDADSYMTTGILSELTACPFCGAKMRNERKFNDDKTILPADDTADGYGSAER